MANLQITENMFQHGQVIIKERMFTMRFEVIIAVVVKLDVFCAITPYWCQLLYFRRAFWLHHIQQNMNHLYSSGSKVPSSELHAQLLVQLCINCRDQCSLVSIVTVLLVGQTRVQILVQEGDTVIFIYIHISPVADPAYNSVHQVSFPRPKWLECDIDHLCPSSTKVETV